MRQTRERITDFFNIVIHVNEVGHLDDVIATARRSRQQADLGDNFLNRLMNWSVMLQ